MSDVVPKFTVCVLLYGDYPELAARCLNPRLLALLDHIELRVAMNDCGKSTTRYVESLVEAGKIHRLYHSDTNRFKYPVLREMVHGDMPVTTPYLMWFDDDSYLDNNGQPPELWLQQVARQMETADMIGSKYTRDLQGNMHQWIAAQPWYTGKPEIKPKQSVTFLTGGWWVIRTEILRKYDWPTPELQHCGGDALLGVLFSQQGLRMTRFNSGVCINADANGVESKAKRRGHDEPMLGTKYQPPPPVPPKAAPKRVIPQLDLEL